MTIWDSIQFPYFTDKQSLQKQEQQNYNQQQPTNQPSKKQQNPAWVINHKLYSKTKITADCELRYIWCYYSQNTTSVYKYHIRTEDRVGKNSGETTHPSNVTMPRFATPLSVSPDPSTRILNISSKLKGQQNTQTFKKKAHFNQQYKTPLHIFGARNFVNNRWNHLALGQQVLPRWLASMSMLKICMLLGITHCDKCPSWPFAHFDIFLWMLAVNSASDFYLFFVHL